MKRTLIAASLVCCSGALLANECDVNIDGKMTLENQVLTVTTEESDLISIGSNHQLSVNGTEIKLSQSQQQWVKDYYNGIYAAVPQAASIAVEGVALASSVISEVFGGLLGQDNEAIERVTDKLSDIGDKVHASFYAEDGSIHVDSVNFGEGDMFGEQWANEFEESVKEVISNSIGHLLIAIGTQFMFSEDGAEDFDQRMANFSQDLEKRLEAQATVIEEKAEALCQQITSIDLAENQLQSTVKELSDLDVFSVQTDKRRM